MFTFSSLHCGTALPPALHLSRCKRFSRPVLPARPACRSAGPKEQNLTWREPEGCTCRPLHGGQRKVPRSRRSIECRAETEASTSANDVTEDNARLKRTIAGLDSLLGIQEEELKKDEMKAKKDESASSTQLEASVAPGILEKLVEAEKARASNGVPTDANQEKQFKESLTKLIEQISKKPELTDESGATEILGELEKLVEIFKPADSVQKEDIRLLKDNVFGPSTFWVTETRSLTLTDEQFNGGILVRGNLKAPREEVFDKVVDAVQKYFGAKYEVMMIEDKVEEGEEPLGGGVSTSDGKNSPPEPRVAFRIVPASCVEPEASPAWVRLACGALLVLTVLATTQLGFGAALSKLPKETLAYLSDPVMLEGDTFPAELFEFDKTSFLNSSTPIIGTILGLQLLHETAHRVAAWARKVKLGPTFFIPDGSIGTFGGLTPIRGLIRSHNALFDVAAAGPVAGGVAALTLFLVGLGLTTSADPQIKDVLIPVPTALFQGSLLLGGVAQAWLGEAAKGASVAVHPLMVGGWCGLVGTALNLLPVGCIDGGRMAQASFGRDVLGFTSFITYICLAIGILGSSLALPFGLYVLICQRTPEQLVQDDVSLTSDGRRYLAIGLIVLAAAILVPDLTAEVSDMSAGVPEIVNF